MPFRVGIQRGKQPVHFTLGEVLAYPRRRVRRRPYAAIGRISVVFTSLKLGDFIGGGELEIAVAWRDPQAIVVGVVEIEVCPLPPKGI